MPSLMTLRRATFIIKMTIKQLKTSAKLMKTTPAALRSEARARIKKEAIPKGDRPALALFNDRSMGDWSRLTKAVAKGKRPQK
jgi:hypothetical protein